VDGGLGELLQRTIGDALVRMGLGYGMNLHVYPLGSRTLDRSDYPD
jgi:hypothetical protein